eukprot:TRINITY_DN26673_c0_g1_i1.p2 TRINITY_DN26673_c0_g1~~TRINITY_DN26673_c0_g1_i1.p2  ORF type:complete len:218 (-),score=-34.51 TRINITY_DN26673_c0_g1_i1:408-1061(-)
MTDRHFGSKHYQMGLRCIKYSLSWSETEKWMNRNRGGLQVTVLSALCPSVSCVLLYSHDGDCVSFYNQRPFGRTGTEFEKPMDFGKLSPEATSLIKGVCVASLSLSVCVCLCLCARCLILLVDCWYSPVCGQCLSNGSLCVSENGNLRAAISLFLSSFVIQEALTVASHSALFFSHVSRCTYSLLFSPHPTVVGAGCQEASRLQPHRLGGGQGTPLV